MRVGEHCDDAHLVGTPLDGPRVSLTIRGADGDDLRLDSQLVGDFNVENLLVSLGVLEALGIPREKAVAALSQCPAPAGRMQVFGGAGRPTVVVDFAHTPDALARVLAALRPTVKGELTCVFGCGGDRDLGKRPLMGRAAAAGAERLIVTDDNPRTEDPKQIVAGIREGIEPSREVTVEHDRAKAIRQAVLTAKPEDVVLVAGKGHEAVQIRAGNAKPFSDGEEVARALEAWR